MGLVRYCCGIYQTSIWFTVFAVLFTIFLKYPPPKPSERLVEWQSDSGIWFKYRELEYFVKDYSLQHPPINQNVLLLLHGFPTFSMDWHKVFDKLSTRFDRIIAPDFLGYGYSDKPYDHVYSIGEQATMVEALLDSRHLEHVHIMAHDFGDTVAQELIHRYNLRQVKNKPGVVYRTFCLLNGGIIQETLHPRWGQKLLLVPYVGRAVSYINNYYMFKRGLSEVFGESTQPMEDEISDYWAALRHNHGYLVLPQLLRYLEERRNNSNKWVGALRATKIPGVVIYGPSDPVNPPEFVIKFRELVPNVGVNELDPHIGHYPQLEDPLTVVNVYFKFLASLPPADSGMDFTGPVLRRAPAEDERMIRRRHVGVGVTTSPLPH